MLSLLSARSRYNHAGDPFWSNVSALLYMEGANNSTVFTDQTGTVWTPNGSAKILTAQAKFGTSSEYSTANTLSAISTVDATKLQMGTGDFTYEGWYLPDSTSSSNGLGVHYVKGVNTAGGLLFGLTSTTGALRYSGLTTSTATFSAITSWTHIAYVRYGTTIFMFVGGVAVITATVSFNNNDTSSLCIGGNVASGDQSFAYAGYSDCLRLTKGIARYTGTFTPPTRPFPDY